MAVAIPSRPEAAPDRFLVALVVSVPRGSLGILTDAILAGERDSCAIGQQKALTASNTASHPLEDPMTPTTRRSPRACCVGQ